MSHQCAPPHSPFRVAITLAAVLLAVVLAGCSGDDEPGDAGPSPTGAAVQSSTASLPAGTRRTTVRVGEIAGRLSRSDRARVREEVGRAVDRWWRAAWLRPDYPRTRIRDPFPGFSTDAARLARQEARTMSAAAVSRRIGGFVARQRSVTVDVLAPGGRPAAATARFRLGLGAWDRDLAQRLGVMRITGRLFLTPAGRRWEIFGFRVAEDRPRALLPEKKTAAQKKVTQKKAARKRATEKKKASRKAAATRQKRGRR